MVIRGEQTELLLEPAPKFYTEYLTEKHGKKFTYRVKQGVNKEFYESEL